MQVPPGRASVWRTEETMGERQTALVTGGTRGIGLGIARRLADDGFDLALCGRRPASDLDGVLDDLRGRGVEVEYVPADISSGADRARLVGAVRERFGRLHVLVNNAGVAPRERADILDASEESFDYVLGVNLKGPYFLTQAVARWMVAQHDEDASFRGCIITVSSVSATLASVNRGEYCIAKAGLAMSSQLWAARLAGHGINAYEIRPGIIETDMTAGVRDAYDTRITDGLVPQKRWGTPDDVGAAAAALARGDLGFSTGQVVMVDGGLTVGRL